MSVTDTYLSLFLSKPLWDVWNLFLLGLGRIVPIIAISPFLGGKVLPDPMKIGFGIAITTIFFPYLLQHNTATFAIDFHFMTLLIKEVFIGSILGFLGAIPFFFTSDAGTMIEHQRGSQSLQVTDPSTQVQSSPTGLLYTNVMVATFFTIGGPFLFFEAVYASYTIIPVDQFFNPAFFAMANPLWHTLLKLLTTTMTIALQLSAPALIALLMSDLFLGIVNRMAPQVQISFLLWSLKAFVGIAVLWAAWWLIFKQMEVQAVSWLKMLNKLVNSFV